MHLCRQPSQRAADRAIRPAPHIRVKQVADCRVRAEFCGALGRQDKFERSLERVRSGTIGGAVGGHGQRLADVHGFVIKVEPDRLEEMVVAAFDSLPDDRGRLMRNVAVTVEHDAGPRGLLGLCQGVPLTSRTSGYAGVLPDRITIYRRAICAICDTEEVVEQVRRTVIHEVARHFGIDDARLDELGW